MLFFQSSIILISSVGLKNTFKIIVQYPAIVLTAVFSYWTFGDPKHCCNKNAENRLKVSFRLIWINAVLTAFENVGLFLIHFFRKDMSGPLFVHGDPTNLFFHIISFSFLMLSWMTLIILQNLPKCQRYCCYCCQSNQVFQKTALDPNYLDELIYLSKPVSQDIKMEVQNQPTEDNLDPSILEDLRILHKKLKNVASGSIFGSDEPKQSKLKGKLIKMFHKYLDNILSFSQNVPISSPLNSKTTLKRLNVPIPIVLK